jgi:hypothetical protein
MPAPWVDVDVLGGITSRPPEVTALLDEALELRAKLRAASEELAAAESRLERAEHDDAVAASERLRKGATVGSEQPAVEKARRAVEQARRAERAVTLAAGASLADLAATLNESATNWIATLDKQTAKARDEAVHALSAFEAALAELVSATGAATWVKNAAEDSRWDRRVGLPVAGSVAQTSARATANQQPIDRATLLRYCAELVEPPTPTPAQVGSASSATASSAA